MQIRRVQHTLRDNQRERERKREKVNKSAQPARYGTAVYQCHQWSLAAATKSSCQTLTAITTPHQAHFFSVYYRSLCWRKTTLKGTTCSRHSRRLTPVNTTTAWPNAPTAGASTCCAPLTGQSRHTTGTISNIITKFWFTFVSIICSSIYRRQIQH